MANSIAYSFGYQRLEYIKEFRGKAVESFIAEKGDPEYIFEFDLDSKEGFILFYHRSRKSFTLVQRNWRPSSVRLIDIRDYKEAEIIRFDLEEKPLFF